MVLGLWLICVSIRSAIQHCTGLHLPGRLHILCFPVLLVSQLISGQLVAVVKIVERKLIGYLILLTLVGM